jgi:hypothetical protein
LGQHFGFFVVVGEEEQEKEEKDSTWRKVVMALSLWSIHRITKKNW